MSFRRAECPRTTVTSTTGTPSRSARKRQSAWFAAPAPRPPQPTIHEQRDVLREHWALAEELYGEQVAGRSMRKFAIKYARLHPEHLAVRDAFVAVKAAADWQAVLDRHYATDAPGRDPSGDIDETAQCGADSPEEK